MCIAFNTLQNTRGLLRLLCLLFYPIMYFWFGFLTCKIAQAGLKLSLLLLILLGDGVTAVSQQVQQPTSFVCSFLFLDCV